MSPSPDFILMVEDTIARWLAYRSRARTQKAIAGLPHHIRKDIGWPEPPLPDRHDQRWL